MFLAVNCFSFLSLSKKVKYRNLIFSSLALVVIGLFLFSQSANAAAPGIMHQSLNMVEGAAR